MKQYRKARELAEVYVFGNKAHLTSEDLNTIKHLKHEIKEEQTVNYIVILVTLILTYLRQQLSKIKNRFLTLMRSIRILMNRLWNKIIIHFNSFRRQY